MSSQSCDVKWLPGHNVSAAIDLESRSVLTTLCSRNGLDRLTLRPATTELIKKY